MTQNLRELKIVFAGPMGAGKTTAIETISAITTLRTEVANSDQQQFAKESTTVALDYGEVLLEDGLVLKLFGTPGQPRFDFMWRSISIGALGLIILLDNQRPDSLKDLRVYLDGFKDLASTARLVIAIGRMESEPVPVIADFQLVLAEFGIVAPAVSADVRKREDVMMLLDLLFNQLEFDDTAHEWGMV